MKDYELTQTSKVILLFENKKKEFPNEATIVWYLDQIEDTDEHCMRPFYCMGRYDELWEVKVVAGVIVAWLTYQFEYDDLFYTIKDNTIYIDRLETKDKVR